MYLLQEDKLVAELNTLLQSTLPERDKCEEFGRLRTASHKLTKELLEVDSKEIGRLVEVAG